MVSMIIGLAVPANPITTYTNNQTLTDWQKDHIPNSTYQDYVEWSASWQVNYYYILMFGLPLVIGVI